MQNTYAIYLVFGQRIKIPVNPQEIEIQDSTSHKTCEVLGLGEILLPKKPALKVVSWECFFPRPGNDPYLNSKARAPEFYVDQIEEAVKNKTVGRLIISRSELYDTNMRCVINGFKTIDKGGEPGDIYYSIEFKEYRDYAPKIISVISSPLAGEPAQAAAEKERDVDKPVLRVGASVIANGKYWYDSYGSRPFGTANNLSTSVTRIVEGNPYPVHIGAYGWLMADQLQIVG